MSIVLLVYLASIVESVKTTTGVMAVVGTYDWYSGDAKKILKDLS